MANKSTRRSRTANGSGKRSSRGGDHGWSIPMYRDMLGLVGSVLHGRQQFGAQKIDDLAQAARGFAHDLVDIPIVKTYATAAADQMEGLGEYISETSFEDMLEDATVIAKRYPVATLIFAASAGYGFTRLMSHGQHEQESKGGRKTSANRGSAKRKPSKRGANASRTGAKNGAEQSADHAE